MNWHQCPGRPYCLTTQHEICIGVIFGDSRNLTSCQNKVRYECPVLCLDFPDVTGGPVQQSVGANQTVYSVSECRRGVQIFTAVTAQLTTQCENRGILHKHSNQIIYCPELVKTISVIVFPFRPSLSLSLLVCTAGEHVMSAVTSVVRQRLFSDVNHMKSFKINIQSTSLYY